MRIAGLMLAAGLSKRMGFRKLAAELSAGISLGGMALHQLSTCDLDPLHVVVRADDPAEWLPPRPCPTGFVHRRQAVYSVIPCTDADQGMSRSLECGLRSLAPADPDGVLVALADQPFVDAGWVRRLVRAFMEGGRNGWDYAASGGEEAVMPPVIMSRAMYRAAMDRLQGDSGAGSLLKSGEFKGAVLRPDHPMMLFDVDTPDDLDRARKYWTFADSVF